MFNNYRIFYDPNSDLWGGVGSGALSGAATGTAILPGWGSLVGGLVGAGLGLFEGESQRKKGQDILKQNQYPGYVIPQETLENQTMARTMAQYGLPSQQYQNAMKNIQRQQNQAILQSQDRRSGNQAISTIQQNTNDATANLNAADAAQRVRNIQQLFGVNAQVAGARNTAFDWNQRNRYQQQYQYGMGLLGVGNQNVVHGIDTGVAGLMRSGNLISGLFGPGRGQPINDNFRISQPGLPNLADAGGGIGSIGGNFGPLSGNGLDLGGNVGDTTTF